MASPFPAEIINAALAAKAKYPESIQIPAAVTLAQWAIESGFGKHMPAGSHNPFGIKARPGEPYVAAVTHEFIHGHDTVTTAKFRKFASYAEAFDEHAKLLSTGSPYATARKSLPDANAFAKALTGVYATDPHYGTILISTMKKYGLYAVDKGAAPPEKPSSTAMSLEEIQAALVSLGYAPGPIDGRFGGRTSAAIKAFETDAGLAADGALDLDFVTALKKALKQKDSQK